ncbi:tape measure protein [Pseudomonas brenneri]|uniref:tape measure protein n=1 Tax=Pseudomonas brenneri TaxID=129817 RepID=UPI0028D440BD|nr:tape measure protein [Pseudomonas brenneri]
MASRSLGTLTLDLIARIGGFQQGMDRASRSVASTGAAADAASARINALQGQFVSLSSVAARIAGPLAAAFSVNSVYKATEAYSTLTNRLKLVTGSSSELAAAQKAVFDIAQSSAQPLNATAELYQRIATNQDALKLSGEGVAGVVGTISKTLAISGASAESANAALIQLGQAFASGVLRGEELNSVLEQAPALSQAIAAGMGKTVGELRAMGATGELTAQAVVKAIQSQSGAVDALFARTATTIGNSFTKISNSMTRFVGELDQATGASSRVAVEFVGISQAIDKALPSLKAYGKENEAYFSQAATSGMYAALGLIAGRLAQQGGQALYASKANQTLLASAAATAKGDLYAAQAKQIDAKALLQRAALEIKAAEGKVASDRVRQTSELANIKSVQLAITAERLLEQQRLAAQINDAGRASSIARLAEIRLAEAAIIKKVEQAERSLAATTLATSAQVQTAYAMRTAAVLAYGETTAVVNAAAIASDRAAAASSVTARAFGALATAGRGLLALLGGPAGLVFIAGAVALSFVDFSSKSKTLMGDLGDLGQSVDQVRSEFNKLNEDQQRAQINTWKDKQLGAALAVKEAYSDLKTSIMASMVSVSDIRSPSYSKQLKEFEDVSAKLDAAKASGQALGPVLREAAASGQISPEQLKAWENKAGVVSDNIVVANQINDRLSVQTGLLGQNTGATLENNQAKGGFTTAGEKYLKTLQTQLGQLQDNSDAVKEATRYLAEHKDLSEADRVAIMSAAHAKKAQTEANKAATAETKSNTSALKANLKTFEDAEENYKRQIALIDETSGKKQKATEAEKLAFEIASGNYAKLSDARRKDLEGLAADLDAKKALVKANQDIAKFAALDYNLKESNQTAKDGFAQELAGAGEGDKYKSRLKEFLAIDQDFNKQRREMYKEYKEAELAGDPDAKQNYDKETALLDEALAGRLVIQQDYYNQLDEAQSNWMDGVSSAWQNYVDDAQNYSAQAAEFVSGSLSELTSELGGAFTDIATKSKSIGDAFGDMMGSLAKSVIGALADMAAQWLVYQAVQLLVGKTAQSSAVAGLVGTAQATSFQAQLAAYASTAAIPVFGPALAPGAALAAAAATAPMVAGVASTALMGMAHNGMGNIPKEGTWLLDGGERVVAPEQNKDLTNYLARQTAATESVGRGGGGGGITYSPQITVQAQPGMSDQDARRQGEMMQAGQEAQFRRFLQRELGQNGLLWRRT